MRARPLLVWHNTSKADPSWHDGWLSTPTTCPWCRLTLATTHLDQGTYAGNEYLYHDKRCAMCGWRYDLSWTGESYGHRERLVTYAATVVTSVLRRFELKDPELPLDALGTHLKSSFSDVFSIPWRRFEELVADVFKEHGFRVELTQATRDGGADIIVFSQDATQRIGIIECKRWAEDKTVGVKVVRELVGAGVEWNVSQLWLVTSTAISRDAVEYSENVKPAYTIDLIGGSRLLDMLQVYNRELPPLELIDRDFRDDLFTANFRVFTQ